MQTFFIVNTIAPIKCITHKCMLMMWVDWRWYVCVCVCGISCGYTIYFHVGKGKLKCLYRHVQSIKKNSCTNMHTHLSGIVSLDCVFFSIGYHSLEIRSFNEWGVPVFLGVYTLRTPFTVYIRRKILHWCVDGTVAVLLLLRSVVYFVTTGLEN